MQDIFDGILVITHLKIWPILFQGSITTLKTTNLARTIRKGLRYADTIESCQETSLRIIKTIRLRRSKVKAWLKSSDFKVSLP